jgi:Protein of unknown function (DUF2794)
MTTLDSSEFGPPGAAEPSGGPRTSGRQPTPVFFNRRELDDILDLYCRMVSAGEWRDYAIDGLKETAVFSVFRHASEMPLYRIEKHPKLARRQGAYSVVSATGHILKRGPDLKQVLRVFDRRRFRIVEA